MTRVSETRTWKDSARIVLTLERPNGHRSDIEIAGSPVTPTMLEAAEDLLAVLTTGERPLHGVLGISADDRDLFHRVLDCVDPAATCGIGNDEIGECRDLVDGLDGEKLYDFVARALGVPREEVKRKLLAVAYGGKP